MMNTNHDYPAWVCLDCGNKYGRGYTEGSVCTVHNGTCGICGQQKIVTEPRDFGHLKAGWRALHEALDKAIAEVREQRGIEKRRSKMKSALTAVAITLAATPSHAITFQQGTLSSPITSILAPSGAVQTQYLDIGGFHFEAQTNGTTLALAPDGLWNGTKNQAAALTITRTGGGAFNVGTYSTRNHAGISCPSGYCGAELIAYTALSVDGKKLFGGDTNYLPNTMFGTFDLSWMGAITSLTLAVDEPYVLGHINLSPVPEPSSYAMMLAGLGLISVSFYRRLHP